MLVRVHGTTPLPRSVLPQVEIQPYVEIHPRLNNQRVLNPPRLALRTARLPSYQNPAPSGGPDVVVLRGGEPLVVVEAKVSAMRAHNAAVRDLYAAMALAELTDNAFETAAGCELAVVDEVHTMSVFQQPEVPKAGELDAIVLVSKAFLRTIQELASWRCAAHRWLAALACLLSTVRRSGCPYRDAVLKTDTSPCGVARLAAPRVPRAPGKCILPCPRHPQAQGYALAA